MKGKATSFGFSKSTHFISLYYTHINLAYVFIIYFFMLEALPDSALPHLSRPGTRTISLLAEDGHQNDCFLKSLIITNLLFSAWT